MNKTMKAWRVYDFNDMRLDEIPIPDIKPGWALVKIKVVQPSITEVLRIKGIGTSRMEEMKQLMREKAPIQLYGHEFCGQVVEVGDGVRRVKVGDRVSSKVRMPCGHCEFCLSGRRYRCHTGPQMSLDFPGCFAEYALLPDDILVKLKDNIDDNEGALTQPLSECVQAAEHVSLGDTVVVLGQGSMGMFSMLAARVSGAGLTIAIDVRDDALALAKKLGAGTTINALKDDPVQKVMEITKGIGADVVYDAAGGSPRQGLSGNATLCQAMAMVHYCGKIIAISIISEPSPLDLVKLRSKAINLIFPRSVTLEGLEHTVELVSSRRVRVKETISHVLNGLENIPEAFEITGNKKKYRATGPAQVVVSK